MNRLIRIATIFSIAVLASTAGVAAPQPDDDAGDWALELILQVQP